MKRREFIKLLGTTTGSTLVASCGLQKGTEKLIPHLIPPEDGLIPGQSAYYSTTCTECPSNCGLSVRVLEKLDADNRYERYPVKLEGIPGHPINDERLCIRGQASLTRLYHPERLKAPLARDGSGQLKEVSWESAYGKILDSLRAAKSDGRRNVYLSGRTTGSLAELIDTYCQTMEIERLPEFELYAYAALREANGILYNSDAIPSYNIEKSDFLLTVGADIFETYLSPINHAVQFARTKDHDGFRWVHVEPHRSMTGFSATERVAINPGSEVYLLLFLLNALRRASRINGTISGDLLAAIPQMSVDQASRRTGIDADKLNELAQQLTHATAPLVMAGGVSARHRSGLDALVLTGMIQWMTGAHGSLVDFPGGANYSNVGTLLDTDELSRDLQDHRIGVVFISRSNPVASLSPSFARKLRNAELKVGLAELMNETVAECDVVLPLLHSLESWGDAEPRHDITTVIRPVLKPLHDNTRAEGDVLLQLLKAAGLGVPSSTYQEYVRNKWAEKYGENVLEEALDQGYHERVSLKSKVELKEGKLANYLSELKPPEEMKKPVLMVAPSLRWFDGRSRDLPLLHEIPDPVTTVSYGKWVSISPETAKRKSLKYGDELEISSSNTLSVRLPVFIQEGLEDELYVVQQGMIDSLLYQADERTGEIVTYHEGVTVLGTGRTVKLPILSGSVSQKGKGIIPYPHHGKEEHDYTLFPVPKHEDYRWAMAIDLDRCTGCSACVAACYVENNIPVVGPKEHLIGREMSWIRIEQHPDASERTNFLPMLCQHCDYAPCETVCPTFAANHDPDGLNAQIYNRCVGTRYCANNCPYKARRFNWFDWSRQSWPKPMDKMQNPDHSIRFRGVMEKCTFCVQRIRAAKDGAKDESRKVRDGEVVPACAQTCPTNAITFGSILEPDSRVSELSRSDRSFRIFEDLGTGPAVHYLFRKDSRHEA
jgi:anaerobic selenocysteine-containing dehydrogenase/Fe-S-cluster-containing dehydrogenase component